MNQKHLRNITALTLSAGILVSQIFSTAVDASSRTFYQQVTQDEYQRTISKRFLGRSYGTGKGQYVCNTYVEKAFESIQAEAPKQDVSASETSEISNAAIKNINIRKGKKGVPTSYDWSSYRVKITYTPGEYDSETDSYTWDSETTATIKHHNKGTSLNSLELGDVLVYGHGGGHIALYFGEYENMSDVVDRLIELGVYKSTDLKKKGDRYVSKKGKPIVRKYKGAGNQWRIHATNKGLLIDNAIVSRSSNGTSSFGKWTKTIESGFDVYNDIVAQ